ncbi:hypothetical protein PQX77_010656 [Marasmius sp. AFHP31]|nr:hypothetical protein PQX77_010656 [Marasmius sp. AFHP31]
MATQTAEEPQRLQANLRDLADDLRATDNEHPLLEVAQDACYFMTDLITKDRGHSISDRGYRGFYKVVQDIIKLLENRQNIPEPTGLRRKPALIKLRMKCSVLRRELKKEFKNTSGVPRYPWENSLILAGGVVSMLNGVSGIPGSTLLKPIGTVLRQLGELIKTLHGNTEEIRNLLYLATRIYNDLSAKIRDQMQSNGTARSFELTEEMTQHIEAFGRILDRIRGYVEKLGRKTLAKRCLRVVLASTTKEDLAAFRKELMDAHTIFMTSNISAIRLKVYDAVHALSDNKEDLAALRREQMETTSNVVRVDNAVRSLSKIIHDGDTSRTTKLEEQLMAFEKKLGDARIELVVSCIFIREFARS